MITEKLEGVYTERSSAQDAKFKPELQANGTGTQIIAAFESAAKRFNAGVEMAQKYGLRDEKYQTGNLEVVVESITPDTICLGTRGNYPSANMSVVLEPTNNETVERTFQQDAVLDQGTKICLVHVDWDNYKPKKDLPMQENFYRSVRQTLVSLFQTELRQQDI